MARKLAPSVLIENEIVGRLRSGEDQGAILADIRQRFPNVNPTKVMGVIARERSSQSGIDRINRSRGRSASTKDVAVLAGCPPGSTIQVRAVVTYTDPETGELRQFGHTIYMGGPRGEVPASGEWSAILEAITDAVRRAATRKGYRIPNAQTLEADSNYHVEFARVDCR